MSRAALAALAAALLGGCALAPVHPGQTVLRQRCTACHVVPDAGALREKGPAVIISAHRDRLQITPDELHRIEAFVAVEPPR